MELPSWEHEATRCNGPWLHVCLFSVLDRKSPLDRPDQPKIPQTGLITTASSRAQISLEELQKNQSVAGLEGGLFQSPSIKNDKPGSIDQSPPPFLKKIYLTDVG